MSRESIIEKIRNLMQRTSEKGCSESEVEAAMKVARSMMDKHQVDMADLMAAQQKSYTLDDIVEQVVRTHCKLDRWEKSMMHCVCEMTDTKCYMSQSSKYEDGKWKKLWHVTYYGEQTDVAAAHALYVEMLIVFKSMARHRLGQKWTQQHYHYMEGFGHGMLSIFREQKAAERAVHTSNTTGMIRHKSALIKAYTENKLSLTTKKAKPVRKSGENSGAYSNGHSDGRAYSASSPNERSKKID